MVLYHPRTKPHSSIRRTNRISRPALITQNAPRRRNQTHRLNLRTVLEHDLILVVHIAELFLGDINPSSGDVKRLAFLKLFVEVVDGVVEPCRTDFALFRLGTVQGGLRLGSESG